MSNPSGTDHDHDTDPVTEVIEIGDLVGPTDTATGARRYTAPGFDAGSTQIIDRVPDAETEFISAPAHAFGATGPLPRVIGPQAIPPSSPSARQSRWLIPVILFVAALAAALILGLILIKKADSAKASRENMVRSTIQTFDTAVQKGDLATLRSVTCGQTRDNYVNYDGVLKIDGEVGNKKVYDPRSYLKLAEAGMAARVVEACNDLHSAGRSVSAG